MLGFFVFDRGVFGRSIVGLSVGLVRPGFEGSNLSVCPNQVSVEGWKLTSPLPRGNLYFSWICRSKKHIDLIELCPQCTLCCLRRTVGKKSQCIYQGTCILFGMLEWGV